MNDAGDCPELTNARGAFRSNFVATLQHRCVLWSGIRFSKYEVIGRNLTKQSWRRPLFNHDLNRRGVSHHGYRRWNLNAILPYSSYFLLLCGSYSLLRRDYCRQFPTVTANSHTDGIQPGHKFAKGLECVHQGAGNLPLSYHLSSHLPWQSNPCVMERLDLGFEFGDMPVSFSKGSNQRIFVQPPILVSRLPLLSVPLINRLKWIRSL